MKVLIEVDESLVESCIESAFASTVPQWAMKIGVSYVVTEDEGRVKWPASRKSRVDGLAIMAAKYPIRFADFFGNDHDASTGDVLIQCILFGEVRYG